jgi:hypothetical protein
MWMAAAWTGSIAFGHDIEFVVVEAEVHLLQAALIPAGVAAEAKKIGAHIVVNAMNGPAEVTEMINNLRANETGGTGDEERVFHEEQGTTGQWNGGTK